MTIDVDDAVLAVRPTRPVERAETLRLLDFTPEPDAVMAIEREIVDICVVRSEKCRRRKEV